MLDPTNIKQNNKTNKSYNKINSKNKFHHYKSL